MLIRYCCKLHLPLSSLHCRISTPVIGCHTYCQQVLEPKVSDAWLPGWVFCLQQNQSFSASTSNMVFFRNCLKRPVPGEKKILYHIFGYRTRVEQAQGHVSVHTIPYFLVIVRASWAGTTRSRKRIVFLGIFYFHAGVTYFWVFLTKRKSPQRSSWEPERLSLSFLFSTSTHKDHGSHKLDANKLPICYSCREDLLEFSTLFLPLQNTS